MEINMKKRKPQNINYNEFRYMLSKSPLIFSLVTLVMAAGLLAHPVWAQAQAQDTASYPVGNPVGLTSDGGFQPISSNATVYGGMYRAEACTYAPERGAIVVPSRGAPPNVQTNDAWISLLNHDGSAHTVRWIGIQQPDQRSSLSPPLVLNEPMGSDVINGTLYVADRTGAAGQDDPSVAIIHKFSMQSGKPIETVRIEDAPWINDIEVTEDGTIYATQTGEFSGPNPNQDTWKVWKVAPGGEVTVFAQGAPLNAPNGIAFDPDGNIVVVNFGNTDVLTYSAEAELLKTENAAQPGTD